MKNKYLKTIMTLALLLVCAFTFSITSEAKTTLKLNTASKNLKKGTSFTLKATSNVKNKKKIKWSTSDKKIVSISKTKGDSIEIKGKSYGTAIITCKVGKNVKRCRVKIDKYGMTKQQEKAFKKMNKYIDMYMQNLGYETIESDYIDAWNRGVFDNVVKSDGVTPLYANLEEILAAAPGFGCGYTYLSLDADKLDDDNFMKNKWLNVQWFFERNGYHLYGVEWDTEFTTKTCYVVKLYYS